jgi:pyruvate kinase
VPACSACVRKNLAAMSDSELTEVAEALEELRVDMLAAEREGPELARLGGDARWSAENLIHYLELRSHDVRELQQTLLRRGLSSLGRAEADVLASLDAVLDVVGRLPGAPGAEPGSSVYEPADWSGRALLEARASELFGAAREGRSARIMVTMPTGAAGDRRLVRSMAAAGMDIARINASHDGPSEWLAMARNVREATPPGIPQRRVLVDIPGPKSRTGPIPGDKPLVLQAGDRLALLRDGEAERDPPAIGCSLEMAFDHAQAGDPVSLDDGKFAGVIEHVDAERMTVRIERAGTGRAKLRAGKGINFPQTDLSEAALSQEDLDTLEFAAAHADIAGLSFVSKPEHIRLACETLDAQGGTRVGIILKIETAAAFERLPDLLIEALAQDRPAGVMIARGDLAVEVGPERLAEVQEEVLWLSEAAHLPAIWATQVLESLAKSGFPSRAEITDAAMGGRAECVMLNKGPRIVDAIAALDSILRRMAAHQVKKTALLRRLTAWE